MSTGKETIKLEKLLLVEGKDEENFFEELLNYMGMKDIQIISYDGKDNLKNKLEAITRIPDFSKVKVLGIIRDADEDVNKAFQSVRNTLKISLKENPYIKAKIKKYTYSNFEKLLPQKPGIFSSGFIKIGIYIMPDNKENGMLEDLCLRSVKDSPLINCIDELFKCAKQIYESGELKEYFKKYEYFKNKEFYKKIFSESDGKIKNISKARVQAYLSTMPVVVSSIGIGAKKGYWNLESEVLDELKKFLMYYEKL